MQWLRFVPRGWTLVSVLLTALFVTTAGSYSPALAQVTTTQVADTIYRADGSTATGTAVISWPQFTTAAGQSVTGGTISTTIAAGGALSVQLAPNAGSNPMGSYYTVVYHLNDGTVSHEYWVVPASATPVKVTAIRSTVLPASVAMQTVSKSYVDTAIAAAVAGTPLGTTTPYVQKTGDTMTGPLVLPGDPVAPNEASDKHYVDAAVAGFTGGVGQKVSLLPQATQVVAQPTGTQLQVNNINGVEFATQYVSGQGNNGIANAVSSTNCPTGCEVKVENDYNSLESYNVNSWPNQTHIEDARRGSRYDTYFNTGSPLYPQNTIGQTINMISTQNSGNLGSSAGNPDPFAVGLSLNLTAPTGGSNLFPASIETTPYFKSNYVAQTTTGTFNAMGQHSLSEQTINCYGVGDCLIGSQVINASGGFRDEADEGAHPFDLAYVEDARVFAGTCASGCSAGSTSVIINSTSSPGTQGEGRFLINKNPTKVISTGLLTGGTQGAPYAGAVFSGSAFPVSVFLATAQLAPSQANNTAPGTVTLPIATTGVSAGFATNTAALPSTHGIACVADQDPAGSNLPHNYEMANYTVIDGTHLQLTLNKAHAPGSTIAVGGLCGYGLEQTVDTQGGIRQIFPVVGSTSPTTLYYAGGLTAVVGEMDETSGFANVLQPITSIVRTGNVVTLTAAGAFSHDVNGLSMTIQGVADSSYNGTFTVTGTGANTVTYAQNGPNSSSANGTVSVLTGGYALYPMAEVLGVVNPATKQLDGQMTLAPNTVAWAAGDVVEQPHYYQERVAADTHLVVQVVPRPTNAQSAGIVYGGMNSQGLTGWTITNATSPASYFGGGGTHTPPGAAYSALGVWQQTMQLDAGQSSVFTINCNFRGCNHWNSGYDLFQLLSSAGEDVVHYQPQSSILNFIMRGNSYSFTPQGFNAGTINAGVVNASSFNGPMNGNSITSGAVASAFLPQLGASGTTHASGLAPDPGPLPGVTRFLREDGTWSVPTGSGAGGGTLLPGATADYNFLQGAGTIVADSTGNGNNGTFSAGAAAPSWTSTGLAFQPGQGVSMPASLNGTQTYFAGLYINPISSGPQPANTYPVIVSSSTGGGGFNLLYDFSFGANGFVANAYAPALYVNNQRATLAPNLMSGFHVLAVVLGSGASSVDHVYIDGTEVASYTAQGSSAGAQTTGNLFLGSSNVNPWQGSGILGTMYRFRTYPTQLSASAVQAVSYAISNEVSSRGVAVTPANVPLAAPQFHAIGDSITFGFGVSTPWPSLLALTNQPAYTITDWGITGITLAAITGSEPNRAALRCRSTSGPSLAVVFAGTNDFSLVGITPAQVLTNLLGEVQTMKQAGCKVFVGTMVSRGGNDNSGSTFDADKDAYNALILSQARAGGADGIIDFAANPLVGADGANTNAYFQADHIHPTQAGQALLAAAASNVLNYTFGSNEGSPHVVTAPNYTMTAADGYVSLSGLTGSSVMTLPDCTGPSGVSYRINNPQSAYSVSVVPLNASQTINGLSTMTVPANGTLTLRDVPNPRAVSGCHWEM